MRLDGSESDNVQDVRGSRGGLPIGGGLGVGAIVVALIGSYVFGIDPGVILGLLEGGKRARQRSAHVAARELIRLADIDEHRTVRLQALGDVARGKGGQGRGHG